ncbi:MAG TPA: PKD domain-containing protein [Longimicrobium sp.]|nr:PKD domain-containing protein [Longimicrobium sp.]
MRVPFAASAAVLALVLGACERIPTAALPGPAADGIPGNTAPVVDNFVGSTILVGETWSLTGTFTDPEPDEWTATATYGDGPAEPVPVSGQSFFLSHTYTAAGSYGVTVTVTDDEGGSGSTGAVVEVLTPAQGTDALANSLDDLIVTGQLTADQVYTLQRPLFAAADLFAAGRTSNALNKLDSVEHRLVTWARQGRITAATRDQIVAELDRLRAASAL